MAYREGAGPSGRRVVRAGSSLAVATALSVALAVGLFIALYMSEGVALDCSRAAGVCEITRVVGPAVATSRSSIAIVTIERALISETVDDEGEHLEGIALFHGGEPHLLDGYSNVGGDAKRAWVAEVNTFLVDPHAPSLHIGGGQPTAFWGWTLLTLLSAIVVLASRTHIVVDYDKGTLALQRNLLLPAKTFALSSIASVVLDSEEDDGTTMTTPMLVFRDGTKLALRIPSNVELALKERLVADLSAALGEPS